MHARGCGGRFGQQPPPVHRALDDPGSSLPCPHPPLASGLHITVQVELGKRAGNGWALGRNPTIPPLVPHCGFTVSRTLQWSQRHGQRACAGRGGTSRHSVALGNRRPLGRNPVAPPSHTPCSCRAGLTARAAVPRPCPAQTRRSPAAASAHWPPPTARTLSAEHHRHVLS